MQRSCLSFIVRTQHVVGCKGYKRERLRVLLRLDLVALSWSRHQIICCILLPITFFGLPLPKMVQSFPWSADICVWLTQVYKNACEDDCCLSKRKTFFILKKSNNHSNKHSWKLCARHQPNTLHDVDIMLVSIEAESVAPDSLKPWSSYLSNGNFSWNHLETSCAH